VAPIQPFRTIKRFMIFTAVVGLELAFILNIRYVAEYLPPDVPFVRRAAALRCLILFPLNITFMLLCSTMVLRENRRETKFDRSAPPTNDESGPPSH
jgi:hypothetical protein